MDSKLLKDEFDFYLKNQSEFVEKYLGKYIVLKNHKVLGVYDSNSQAYQKTEKSEELGTFLIQYVEAGENSYTQTFHSRVLI